MTNRPSDRIDTLVYDPETGTYRTRYDTAMLSPSIAAVLALEAVAGNERVRFHPLAEAIDPEALDSVLERRPNEADWPSRSVTFTYCGYRIRITGDGIIEIREPRGNSGEKSADQ